MERILGIICGIIVGLVVAAAILFVVYRGKSIKEIYNDYDERQKAVRGECFKTAFFTGVIFFLIISAYGYAEFPAFMDTSFTSTLGAGLMIVVFAIKAIIKDAYMGLHEDAKLITFIGLLVGVANLVVFFLVKPEVIKDGVITCGASNLVYAFVLIFVFAFYAIYDKFTSKGHDEEEGDDEEP